MASSLKEFPFVSAGSAIGGGLTLSSLFLAPSLGVGLLMGAEIPLMFGSPFISAGLVIPAAIDFFSKKRTGLSKTFSAAAAGAGALGCFAALTTGASAGLGAIAFSLVGMTVAGALNVASHLTRNTGLSVNVNISKEELPDKSQDTPQPPAP